MNVYCKMRSVNSTKSRSMDITSLDNFSAPQTPKSIADPNPTPISTIPPTPISTIPPTPTPKSQTPSTIDETNNNNLIKPTITHDSSTSNDQEDVSTGQKFGVILTRNCSVSSSVSVQKYRGGGVSDTCASTNSADKKQNKALQAAVIRAFSMRRSASVSEGYSRIHDQSDPFSSSPTQDDLNNNNNKSKKKKKNKRSGKIFKACKSFFGL